MCTSKLKIKTSSVNVWRSLGYGRVSQMTFRTLTLTSLLCLHRCGTYCGSQIFQSCNFQSRIFSAPSESGQVALGVPRSLFRYCSYLSTVQRSLSSCLIHSKSAVVSRLSSRVFFQVPPQRTGHQSEAEVGDQYGQSLVSAVKRQQHRLRRRPTSVAKYWLDIVLWVSEARSESGSCR